MNFCANPILMEKCKLILPCKNIFTIVNNVLRMTKAILPRNLIFAIVKITF